MNIVIFTDTNARIIQTDVISEDHKDNPNIVIDPDLSKVVGVPPHFWIRRHGRIEEMDQAEKSHRLSLLETDKTNIYTVNDMFLKVESLQVALNKKDILISDKDNHISHLETNVGELNKQVSRWIEVNLETQEKYSNKEKQLAEVIKLKNKDKEFYDKAISIRNWSLPIIYLIGVLCGYVTWN